MIIILEVKQGTILSFDTDKLDTVCKQNGQPHPEGLTFRQAILDDINKGEDKTGWRKYAPALEEYQIFSKAQIESWRNKLPKQEKKLVR